MTIFLNKAIEFDSSNYENRNNLNIGKEEIRYTVIWVNEIIENTKIKQLLAKHNITEYNSLNELTIAQFLNIVRSDNELKEYIKNYFDLSNLKDFIQKNLRILWQNLYPTDLTIELKNHLRENWIIDQKTLLSFLYLKWSYSKFRVILTDLWKTYLSPLKDNNIKVWDFSEEDINDLLKYLWWDNSFDTSMQWLVDKIKSYDILEEVRYKDEFIDVYKNTSQEKHIELFLLWSMYLNIKPVYFNTELEDNQLAWIERISETIWLKEITREDVINRIWRNIRDENHKILESPRNKSRLLLKYLKENINVVCKLKEVKLLLKKEEKTRLIKEIKDAQIPWLEWILKTA